MTSTTGQNQLLRSVIREVSALRRQVRDQGRGSQAAFRSVELSDGSPTYYDAFGPVARVRQDPATGSVALVPAETKPVVVPTSPDAIGAQNGINVVWDGTFVNANWDSNIAYVEIHRGHADGFVPVDTTQVGAFTSYYGGQYFWASVPEEGEQWFCLVTVDRAGRRSASSGYDSATALRVFPTTDGDAPATSPDVFLRGGIGALFGSWTAVNNEDAVTYEVHLLEDDDTTVPVAGDPDTLVAETGATLVTIKQKPNGDVLSYTSVYTMWIIAKDADGPAAPGAPASATMMLVTTADIAADFAYIGDILANQITGGVMNATVLLAGLFQTATSGGRTEIGPFGIRIYDSNGVDINVDLNGVLNRFRGSIDATDIIIRDALQMFGKLNKMGAGAVLTLTSTTSAPTQAPTVTWEYEERARPGGGAYLTGVWFNAAESQSAGSEVFWRSSWLQRNGALWQSPDIVTASGDVWAERMFWGSGRIAESAGNGLLVTQHDKRANGDTGWPKNMVGVWDDSLIPSGGAPILKGEIEVEPYNLARQSWLVPVFNGGTARDRFMIIIWDTVAKTLEWRQYRYTTAGGLVLEVYSGPGVMSTSGWAADEMFAGAVWGTALSIGVKDTDSDYDALVVHTNKFNYVYQWASGSMIYKPNSSWPTTFDEQRRPFVCYDPYTNTVARYNSMNWAAGTSQRIYRYANNFKIGADTWWASYAWRGEYTKVFRTEDSVRTSIAYRRRARFRLSVPALPAPAAGIGAARDPLVDPYGWVYFLGHGGSEPSDANIFEQPAQPVMSAGVVLADSSIVKEDYPTWSGTNPVSSSTFPASTPSRIQSDSGLYFLDGNGDFAFRDGDFRDISTRQVMLEQQAAAPAAPGSGLATLYVKSADGLVYKKLPSGVEKAVEQGYWTTYTPSISGFTVGASTATGKWTVIGKTFLAYAKLTLGAGFSLTGAPTVSIPVTLSGTKPHGRIELTDVGTSSLNGFPSPSTTGITAFAVTGSAAAAITNTAPFTWAVGDTIEYWLTGDLA